MRDLMKISEVRKVRTILMISPMGLRGYAILVSIPRPRVRYRPIAHSVIRFIFRPSAVNTIHTLDIQLAGDSDRNPQTFEFDAAPTRGGNLLPNR